MNSDSSFTLKLSPTEIIWLARTIGYVHIPFLKSVILKHDVDATNAELEAAKRRLSEREVIHYLENATWWIDRLLLVLMELIANPQKLLMIRLANKKSFSRNLRAYVGHGFVLLVNETDDWEFVFFESQAELFRQIYKTIDLPAVSSATGRPIVLENFESVTRGTWIDPITITSLGSDEPSRSFPWGMDFFAPWETIAVFCEWESDGGELHLRSRNYFFWNNKCIWNGIPRVDGAMEFVPVPSVAVSENVQLMKTVLLPDMMDFGDIQNG